MGCHDHSITVHGFIQIIFHLGTIGTRVHMSSHCPLHQCLTCAFGFLSGNNIALSCLLPFESTFGHLQHSVASMGSVHRQRCTIVMIFREQTMATMALPSIHTYDLKLTVIQRQVVNRGPGVCFFFYFCSSQTCCINADRLIRKVGESKANFGSSIYVFGWKACLYSYVSLPSNNQFDQS